MCSTPRQPASWERSLRQQFIERYGASMVPLPDCLEDSALLMALRLSPRYMPEGVREAAMELVRDPAFLASMATALVLYVIAWAAPEPLFTKAFAVSVTLVLTLTFTLAELTHAGMTALRLYQETQGYRTLEEIEAAAKNFGQYLGGAGLRILVFVASRAVARQVQVPQGGPRALLTPRRFSLPGGSNLSTATSVQAAAADGSLIIAGVAMGTTGSTLRSACKDGSLKLPGYTWHHLATDKNEISSARGGPWTPLFEEIFLRVGMTLDDTANKVFLYQHEGPHPEEYHKRVYARLLSAVQNCQTQQQCKNNLINELFKIGDEVCTPGTLLHRLVTKP